MSLISTAVSSDYTNEELEALPSTDMVFDAPDINLNEHILIQDGYRVVDICSSHPTVSFNIPSGKLLIKDKGGYTLIDERVS